MDMEAMGKKISVLRKERDMTQTELADILGVTYQAVSSWERGQSMPDIAKLPDISQVLAVSIDDLLGNVKEAVAPPEPKSISTSTAAESPPRIHTKKRGVTMYENYSNGRRMVNGHVKPPIVLRNEGELFIAQSAHNLVWDKYWDECTVLDHEIEFLQNHGRDSTDARIRLQQVISGVKKEIDELIVAEISEYRNNNRV